MNSARNGDALRAVEEDALARENMLRRVRYEIGSCVDFGALCFGSDVMFSRHVSDDASFSDQPVTERRRKIPRARRA